MRESNQKQNTVRDVVPAGFTLESQSKEAFIIRYKRTGMGGVNIFLIFWLSFWTVGCIFLLCEYIAGGVMDDGNPIPLWVVMVFWGAEVLVANLLFGLLFCKKLFRIDKENLIMETNVLGFKRQKVIPRRSIQRFVQVKDGGVDEDSFPSWGLIIEGEKSLSSWGWELEGKQKATLVYRQPYEKSLWLGQILAGWANVGFVKAPAE